MGDDRKVPNMGEISHVSLRYFIALT
jgi:hypothetical protein